MTAATKNPRKLKNLPNRNNSDFFHIYTDWKSKCYNQSEALNELSNYKLPVVVTY